MGKPKEPRIRCPNKSCPGLVGEKWGLEAHFKEFELCREVARRESSTMMQDQNLFPPHSLNATVDSLKFGSTFGDDSSPYTDYINEDNADIDYETETGYCGVGSNPLHDYDNRFLPSQLSELSEHLADDEEEESAGVNHQGGIDESLFLKTISRIDHGIGKNLLSEELKVRVELLQILEQARSPKYLFPVLLKLIRSVCDRDIRIVGPISSIRDIKDLTDRYQMKDSLPVTNSLTLPRSLRIVDVTTYDFRAQLYSLLSDTHLMCDTNLLFFEDHPFGVPVGARLSDHVLTDITDGSVYRKAYSIFVQIEKRDLLVPIILFIDKTHIDAKGRLCLEPVTFTLGIFTKEARKHSYAWRPLGFIVNQNLGKTGSNPTDRAEDYHFVLSHILGSLKKAQASNGIHWSLVFAKTEYNVVMKIPILLVIGDNEGHDKLCGKYLNRNASNHLCRYCNIPREKTGRAHIPKHPKLKFTRASAIAHLAANNELVKLKFLSYHCLNNAFTGLIFCDDQLGINGATVAEVLHLLQHGLFQYFGKALFKEVSVNASLTKIAQKAASAAAKKRKQVSCAEESEVEDEDTTHSNDETDSDTSERTFGLFEGNGTFNKFGNAFANIVKGSYKVFTPTVEKEFDDIAEQYGSLLRHQSDREWERSHFTSGIVNVAQRSGHEERCVLILCHIIFCSDRGDYFQSSIGQPRFDLYMVVLSHLLMLENFFRSSTILKSDIKSLQKFIPIFLSLYKMAVNRQEGVKMNFLKFHLLHHFANDLLRFGPASSFDSSAGESMHKTYKDNARRTQKNTKTLDKQTAANHSVSTLLDRAMRDIHPTSTPSTTSSCSTIAKGAQWIATMDGIFDITKKQPPSNTSTSTNFRQPAVWADSIVQSLSEDLLKQKVLPGVPNKSVILKSQATVDGILYRADPGAKSHRHDWVNVQWVDYDLIPARIIAFVELPAKSILTGNTSVETERFKRVQQFQSHTLMAIVQSLQAGLYGEPNQRNQKYIHKNYLANQNSKLVRWSEICHTSKTTRIGNVVEKNEVSILYLIPVVASFRSPVIAIPYNITGDDGTDPFWWLFIESTSKWNNIFRKEMKLWITQKN